MPRASLGPSGLWRRGLMAASHEAFKNAVAQWRSLPILFRRRFVIGGLLLAVVELLALTHEPLLTWFAYLFRVQEPLVRSDAIVILLGNSYDRSSKAAELYRQGLAPIILMGPAPISELENQRLVLMQGGVPADAILILPGDLVKNTHDEAIRVRDYVRCHPVQRIIVVTTAYHTSRTRWTFRKVLSGLDADVRMAASQDRRFTESDWYTREDGIKQYMSEALKAVYYRLRY